MGGGVNDLYNIILLMSLSGSLIVIIYCVITLFTHRTFPTRVRYNLIKAAIIFYLVPFPTFRYLFPLPMPEIWGTSSKMTFNFHNYTENVVIHNQEIYIRDSIVKWAWVYIIVAITITGLYIFWYFIRYFRGKKIITSYSTDPVTPNQIESFKNIKIELGLKKNIRLVFSEYCSTPLTIGFFAPIIVCPVYVEGCGEQEWDFVIRHELNHIKSRDMPISFLSLIVVALHCFNPFAHLLYYEISSMCEIYCDSQTIKTYSQDKRKKYGEYIIDVTAKSGNVPIFGAVGLIGNKLHKCKVKRRILEMKTVKKNKCIASVLATLVVAVTGGASVFAYEPATDIEVPDSPSQSSTYGFCDGIEGSNFDLNTGNIFKDKEGNVYEISNAERALCFHNMVDTYLTKHTLNEDGGCTTVFYDAQRCTKCGYIKGTEYHHEITYKKCPHDI